MDSNKISFNKLDEPKELEINKNDPFFRILEIRNNDEADQDEKQSLSFNLEVGTRTKGKFNALHVFKINLNNNWFKEQSSIIQKTLPIQEKYYAQITFCRKEIDLEIEYSKFNYISNETQEEKFINHLNSNSNIKIMFSSPFGKGKTTFINEVFNKDELNQEYETYKVFPVHYSVATNEDIFKYIKADILFQLMSERVDADFNYEDIEWSPAILNYIYFNPEEAVTGVLKLMMSIGKEIQYIGPVINVLEKLLEKISKHNNSDNKKDYKSAQKYLDILIDKEGSLYDDNFYTKFIREILFELKRNNNKKNVLIIDDLDRIDPDHIFRIFNVISAHCDSYQFMEDQSENKFGFDKIILVCDYSNILNIFKHKYGQRVDHNGYLNKFISTQKFDFDGTKACLEFYKEFVQENDNLFIRKNDLRESLILIEVLIEGQCMSIREFINFKKSNFLDVIFNYSLDYEIEEQNYNSTFKNGYFTVILFFLSNFYGKGTLREKLEKCNKRSLYLVSQKSLLNKYCKYLIASLVMVSKDGSNKGVLKLNDKHITVEVSTSYHYTTLNSMEVTKNGQEKSQEDFTIDEFLQLVILNLERV